MIHFLTQLVASYCHQSELKSDVTPSYEVTTVGQFMRLKPPVFTSPKVEGDPQGLNDEMENIFFDVCLYLIGCKIYRILTKRYKILMI